MIKVYFDHLKKVIDQYTATSFVIDANVNFETRPGEQGYLAGTVTFIDGSLLHFAEFLDTLEDTVDKLMYTYHYQDANYQMVFRYDNARHRPHLNVLEHKHSSNQVIGMPAPRLSDVLAEIAAAKGWI